MFGFEVAVAADYLLATVLMSVDLLRRESKFRQLFLLVLFVGFGIATIDLLLHVLHAVRGGYLPFSGASQIFNGFSWALVVIVLYTQSKVRWFSASALLVPLAFLSSFAALFVHETVNPIRTEPAAVLFVLHVGILLFGVGSICLAFFSALFYLIQQKELKSKRFGKLFGLLPPLETLDRTAVGAVGWGVVLLTLGNLTGIYLAHVYWKGEWVTQNKFVFSMLTWGWFLLLLAVRHFAGWRGGRFFALVVIGFIFLLFTFSLSVIWVRPWI